MARDDPPPGALPFRLTTPVYGADAPSLARHVQQGDAERDNSAEARRVRIRQKSAQAGIQVQLPGDEQPPQDAPGEPAPEVEWVGYQKWPSTIHSKLLELENLERMAHLMEGGADDETAYTFALEIIANGRRGLRGEVSRLLIGVFSEPVLPAE